MDRNFKLVNERLYRNNDMNIVVIGCFLEYEIDYKGFLQPQYRFQCQINEKTEDIIIPCLS